MKRLPTIEEGDYRKYKSQPATLGNKYEKKFLKNERSQKYKKSRRQENRVNKLDSEKRSNESLLEFDRQLANPTKYPLDEKKYRISILTSSSTKQSSTQKGGKRRKPRKTKKHRKKKSL